MGAGVAGAGPAGAAAVDEGVRRPLRGETQGVAAVAGQRVIVQPQTPLTPGAQTGPTMLPSAQIIETVAGAGVGHFSGGQLPDDEGTQAHTEGELSNVLPCTHSTF